MGKLDGKVAFITGIASGQGRAHAVGMAEAGANIIGLDICSQIASVPYPMPGLDDLTETVKLVEEKDRRIVARQADVRDRDALDAVVSDGMAEFGQLDIIVANAGIGPSGDKARQPQAWHDAIDVLLTGVYQTVEAGLIPMLERNEGGSVIITSSSGGLKGLGVSRRSTTAGTLGYVAAKHGVVGLMRHYAASLGEFFIRVNTIHPTGVRTRMVVNDASSRAFEEFPELGQIFQNALPVELLEPEDIANAAIWLASDDARYVTGVTLSVDAGFNIR